MSHHAKSARKTPRGRVNTDTETLCRLFGERDAAICRHAEVGRRREQIHSELGGSLLPRFPRRSGRRVSLELWRSESRVVGDLRMGICRVTTHREEPESRSKQASKRYRLSL